MGYSGFRGTVGGERHQFGQGFVRFKADGSKLEFLRSTNNNSWGLGFSEEGHLFGSTANGCPSVYAPIANRHYERVRGWNSRVLDNIAPGYAFYPLSENVRQVDFFGGFTAAAGHALYTARNYPAGYWNKTAFVAEPTGHLVAIMDLTSQGTDFSANYGGNLVASDDEWCAPIAAEVGPDGYVWVSDWYNIIVQHNPTPSGFETGARGAYETPLRDTTRGRIYRILPDDMTQPVESLNLSAESVQPAELVAALKHTNMFWRLHAQRLLVDRGQTDIVPELIALMQDTTTDAIGLNVGAIHALRVLEGLATKTEVPFAALTAWYAALQHPSAAVRRTAALSAPSTEQTVQQILAAKLLQDPEPHVRMAALLAIADAPATPGAGEEIAKALLSSETANDRWLMDAVTSAAAQNDQAFLLACTQLAVAAEPGDSTASQAASRSWTLATLERIAQHFSRCGRIDELEGLLAQLGTAPPQIASAILGGISQGMSSERRPEVTENLESALVTLHDTSDASGKLRVIALAELWESQCLNEQAEALATTLMETIEDDSAKVEARRAAVEKLASFRRHDPQVAQFLIERLDARLNPELGDAILQALKDSNAKELGAAVGESLSRLTPAMRPKVLTLMLVRSDWTNDMLDCFDNGSLDISDLPLAQKQSLSGHPDAEIAARAQALLKRTGGLPDADRQSVIDSASI